MAQYEFQPLNLPIEQKLEISQQGLWGLVARMVKIIEEKYGDEGLKALYDGLRDWPLHQMSVTARLSAHGIEPGKASPAQFIQKIMNSDDSVSFIQKVKPLITDSPNEDRVLYKIRSCSVADSIAREYPKACRIIARACLEGQTRYANPNLKATCDKFLCEGGDACEVYVERTKG
jgi:hypothetical protein